MKIVFLHDDFPPESIGGAGIVAASLAQELQRKGHEVSVITATSHKRNAGAGEWEGVPVYRIYSSYHERWRAWCSLYNRGVVREVRRLLRELRPEVVHAHNVHYHLSYASLAAAKKSGAKVFLTAHDMMMVHYGKSFGEMSLWRQLKEQRWRYNPFRNFFIRRALRNLDGIFAVSEALKKALERHGISGIHVLHNGIDPQKWVLSEEKVSAFAQTHSLAGRRIIFFGGRISPAKGGEAILAAMPAIVRVHPDALLLIAGKETAYTKSIMVRAAQRGFAANISCTGWLSGDALCAAYHVSNVVIVPSVYLDPFPTCVLEAMACARAVVSTCFGGASEAVQDGETGYVLDPSDTPTLAKRINELLSDIHKCQQFGRAGYQRIREAFLLSQQASKVLEMYRTSS